MFKNIIVFDKHRGQQSLNRKNEINYSTASLQKDVFEDFTMKQKHFQVASPNHAVNTKTNLPGRKGSNFLNLSKMYSNLPITITPPCWREGSFRQSLQPS